jgi:hypothetical protein
VDWRFPDNFRNASNRFTDFKTKLEGAVANFVPDSAKAAMREKIG